MSMTTPNRLRSKLAPAGSTTTLTVGSDHALEADIVLAGRSATTTRPVIVLPFSDEVLYQSVYIKCGPVDGSKTNANGPTINQVVKTLATADLSGSITNLSGLSASAGIKWAATPAWGEWQITLPGGSVVHRYRFALLSDYANIAAVWADLTQELRNSPFVTIDDTAHTIKTVGKGAGAAVDVTVDAGSAAKLTTAFGSASFTDGATSTSTSVEGVTNLKLWNDGGSDNVASGQLVATSNGWVVLDKQFDVTELD